ncbi:hypothetical protein ACFBZI_08385 [Moraxella sp. ZJ142]
MRQTLADIIRLSQEMALTNRYGSPMFERIGNECRMNYYSGNALIMR